MPTHLAEHKSVFVFVIHPLKVCARHRMNECCLFLLEMKSSTTTHSPSESIWCLKSIFIWNNFYLCILDMLNSSMGLLEQKLLRRFRNTFEAYGNCLQKNSSRSSLSNMLHQLYKAHELAAAATTQTLQPKDFQQVIRSNGLMALLAYRISCSAVGISISPLHRASSLSTIWSLKDSCQITATI